MPILEEKYHVEAEIKEPTVIYMKTMKSRIPTIEKFMSTFWASVGLSIEHNSYWKRVQYEAKFHLDVKPIVPKIMEGPPMAAGRRRLYG